MKITHLARLFLMAVAVIVTVTACQDDFDEEDFLQLQADLAEQKAAADATREIARIQAAELAAQDRQIAINEALERLQEELADEDIAEALELFRQAGLVSQVDLLFENDGAPVVGATVSIREPNEVAAAANRVQADATTGDDGVASFFDLSQGSHIASVSAPGFFPATFIITISDLSNQNGNNAGTTSVPTNTQKILSGIIELFSDDTGAGASATVNGVVTYQGDVTNGTREVPQDIMVKVDFSSIAATIQDAADDQANQLSISNYTFDGANVIGSAAVDNTTGEYSLTVPARSEGISIDLIFPTFETDQTMAATSVDGAASADLITTVRKRFSETGSTSAIPFVNGTVGSIDDPMVDDVTGFALALTARTRSINATVEDDVVGSSEFNNAFWTFSRGSGMTSAPTIDTGTDNVDVETWLRGTLGAVSVTTQGNGYHPNRAGTATVRLVNNLGTTNETVLQTIGTFGITTGDDPSATDGNGSTAGVQIRATEDFDNVDDQVTVGPDWDGGVDYDLAFSGATNAVTVAAAFAPTTVGMEVDRFEITSADKFDNSSFPTFTFTQTPATATAPSLAINTFPTQWFVNPDNSGNTGDYPVRPSEIRMFFTASDGLISENNNTNNGAILSLFTIVDGDVVFNSVDATATTNWTSAFSTSEPEVVISDPEGVNPGVTIVIDGGEVDDACYNQTSDGYDFLPTVTVSNRLETGTGAGADVRAVASLSAGEFQMDKFNGGRQKLTVRTKGSGYTDNINRTSDNAREITGSGSSTTINVTPGEEYILNFFYGSGSNVETPGGEDEATCN
ncbi:MAG: hypothetical protein RJQ09_04270 [Cyclobacteriaceae bacterium]